MTTEAGPSSRCGRGPRVSAVLDPTAAKVRDTIAETVATATPREALGSFAQRTYFFNNRADVILFHY